MIKSTIFGAENAIEFLMTKNLESEVRQFVNADQITLPSAFTELKLDCDKDLSSLPKEEKPEKPAEEKTAPAAETEAAKPEEKQAEIPAAVKEPEAKEPPKAESAKPEPAKEEEYVNAPGKPMRFKKISDAETEKKKAEEQKRQMRERRAQNKSSEDDRKKSSRNKGEGGKDRQDLRLKPQLPEKSYSRPGPKGLRQEL